MGNVNINAGLLPPIIAKETTFGVAPKDFNLHDGAVQGLPVNQSFESPINVVDSYNKEVIKSTFGSQVQKDAVMVLGERSVSANFGHQIGLNDFVVIGNMFFQNKYNYIPTITDGTIDSITWDGVATVFDVGDIGTLENGDEVIVSGRLIGNEDGTYNVTMSTELKDIDRKLFLRGLWDDTLSPSSATFETIEIVTSEFDFVPEYIIDNAGTSNASIILPIERLEDTSDIVLDTITLNFNATPFDYVSLCNYLGANNYGDLSDETTAELLAITDATEGEVLLKWIGELTFKITDEVFDSVDLTGLVTATIGTHEMLIEDVNDCSAQLLENSYSIYLPQKFPDKDAVCGTSQGEVFSGVVPKMLDIDFIESTYSIDSMGKSLEDYGDKSPRLDEDYIFPEGTDGYMRKNFGTLQKWNGLGWDNLETLSLNLNVTFGAEDSQKVRSAGELSRAVVDGVDLSGTYETLYVTEDEQKNVSNSIYDNRRLLESGGLYRLALENTSGEAVYIEGNIKFLGEELTRENGGWKLKADFQFLRNLTSPNVKLTCVNRYNKSLENLF